MKINNKIKQLITFIVSVCLLVGFDQYTKHLADLKLKGHSPFVIIKGVFELSYLRNTGAAWGILSGGRILLITFTCIVLVIIAIIVYRTPIERKYLPFRCVLIFLFAGACGNLMDRVVNHYVLDFFYFKVIDFPVFNVSDIYVTVSMCLLIILIFFVYKDDDFKFLSIKKAKKDMGIDG